MAGIIKAHASKLASQAAHGAAFNLADMGDQASSYLNQVREQAAQIVSKARSEAEQIKTKAQADGRQAAQETSACLLVRGKPVVTWSKCVCCQDLAS